jgi:hypothetical protein
MMESSRLSDGPQARKIRVPGNFRCPPSYFGGIYYEKRRATHSGISEPQPPYFGCSVCAIIT